jgi:hypothetical protein
VTEKEHQLVTLCRKLQQELEGLYARLQSGEIIVRIMKNKTEMSATPEALATIKARINDIKVALADSPPLQPHSTPTDDMVPPPFESGC